MHSFLLLLQTTDANLGRVDIASFSDQTLMELLIERFPEDFKIEYRDSDGCFTDVCSWPEVRCDKDSRVVDYYTDPDEVGGSISLEYMPPKMQSFVMRSTRVRGTLEASRLPDSLLTFKMTRNKLEGTVDFVQLPRNLKEFSIFSNMFTGSADLQDLPPDLCKLWIYSNKFSGTICLSKLPPVLEVLDISHNDFCGELFFQNVPSSLSGFCTHGNAFNPAAIVPKGEWVHLANTEVGSVVDVEGNTHPREESMLEL